MLGDFYRGRLSYNEIRNLPAGDFKLYWMAALDKMKTEEGKKQKQAEHFEDELTDANLL